MYQIRKRVTYANVMSSIAVFLVIGGATAFAALGKNTVGTKQLKKNAVIGSKVKNGSLRGADIKLSSLGTVPSAANANHASAADNATHATSADNATIAANASTVGGQTANKLFKTLTEGQTGVPVGTVAGFGITATCGVNDADVIITAPTGPGTVLNSVGAAPAINKTTFDYSGSAPGETGEIQVDNLSEGGDATYGVASVAGATSTGTSISGVIGYDYDTFNEVPPNTCVIYGHLLAG